MPNFYKCDFCETEDETVRAGNWFFYCPKHAKKEAEKIWSNEACDGERLDEIDGDDANLIAKFF